MCLTYTELYEVTGGVVSNRNCGEGSKTLTETKHVNLSVKNSGIQNSSSFLGLC